MSARGVGGNGRFAHLALTLLASGTGCGRPAQARRARGCSTSGAWRAYLPRQAPWARGWPRTDSALKSRQVADAVGAGMARSSRHGLRAAAASCRERVGLAQRIATLRRKFSLRGCRSSRAMLAWREQPGGHFPEATATARCIGWTRYHPSVHRSIGPSVRGQGRPDEHSVVRLQAPAHRAAPGATVLE